MADEVERVEVLAHFLGERFERQPLGASSSMMACLRSARSSAQEVVETGEALPQGLLGEVAQALGDELAVLVEVFDALGDDADRRRRRRRSFAAARRAG